MQYDIKKLERMSLDELKETAKQMGAKIKKSFTPMMIIYAILDAQADQKAADVQAKEEQREAERQERRGGKRERIRLKARPQKIETDQMRSNRVVATVGNEYQTSLDGVDFAGAHVADDALHGGGTNNHTTHEVSGVGKVLFENTLDNVVCENARVELVVLTADSHTEIMAKRSHGHGRDAVVEGAHLFLLQGGRDTGIVEDFEHLEGVVAHRAHVHGTVVVEAETRYSHLVGIILHRLYLLIVDKVAHHAQRQIAPLGRNVYNLLSQSHQPLLNTYFLG